MSEKNASCPEHDKKLHLCDTCDHLERRCALDPEEHGPCDKYVNAPKAEEKCPDCGCEDGNHSSDCVDGANVQWWVKRAKTAEKDLAEVDEFLRPRKLGFVSVSRQVAALADQCDDLCAENARLKERVGDGLPVCSKCGRAFTQPYKDMSCACTKFHGGSDAGLRYIADTERELAEQTACRECRKLPNVHGSTGNLCCAHGCDEDEDGYDSWYTPREWREKNEEVETRLTAFGFTDL